MWGLWIVFVTLKHMGYLSMSRQSKEEAGKCVNEQIQKIAGTVGRKCAL
jgi:hypothetical protein